MPASSKTAAAYWSYAVSMANRSPRSFICRRWCTRVRRGGGAAPGAAASAGAGPLP